MYEDIKDKELYHICIYKDYMLEVGKEYDTADIKRDYAKCGKPKQDREKEFEEYRMTNCSRLPSRKNCLYVCLEENVELWLRGFYKRDPKSFAYKVFKISCTGNIFWADANFFDDDDDCDAEKYWKENVSHAPDAKIEGLFEGKYKAVEECTHKFHLI